MNLYIADLVSTEAVDAYTPFVKPERANLVDEIAKAAVRFGPQLDYPQSTYIELGWCGRIYIGRSIVSSGQPEHIDCRSSGKR